MPLRSLLLEDPQIIFSCIGQSDTPVLQSVKPKNYAISINMQETTNRYKREAPDPVEGTEQQ